MQRGVHVINSQKVNVRNNLLFANNAGIQLGGKIDTFDDATTAVSRNATMVSVASWLIGTECHAAGLRHPDAGTFSAAGC